MSKEIEVGIFLPVGKNGWIHSVNAPHTPGTFEHVLKVTKLAEELGYDFILSPAIWRGRKGPSEHWMVSQESMTTSAALLMATQRIMIWSTVHMTVFPPPTVAKIVATLDQIGPGRVGLNLVTGSSVLDLEHIGLWDDELDHDARYRLGDEWIQLVKRFWAEESVTHKGEFFYANEGTMGPKPSRMPPLVNAGASGRGFQFAVENCDAAFLVAGEDPALIESARNAKAAARKYNKPDFKTFGLFSIVPAATDAEAQARLEYFDAGVDEVALADIAAGYDKNKSNQGRVGLVEKKPGEKSAKPTSVTRGTMIGSYESLAKRIANSVIESELDSAMFIIPDYIEDLRTLASELLPRMEEYGVSSKINRSGHSE